MYSWFDSNNNIIVSGKTQKDAFNKLIKTINKNPIKFINKKVHNMNKTIVIKECKDHLKLVVVKKGFDLLYIVCSIVVGDEKRIYVYDKNNFDYKEGAACNPLFATDLPVLKNRTIDIFDMLNPTPEKIKSLYSNVNTVTEYIAKKTDLNDCVQNIEDIMNLTYGTLPKQDFESVLKKLKKQRELFEIITSNDFYPTPLYVGEMIYEDVLKNKFDNYNLYDISAGLASLSLPFINNINKSDIKHITLLEIEELFVNLLKCFEKINDKIDVIHDDFFNHTLKLDDGQNIIVCNPPYRGFVDGKNEKLFWVYFVVSIINSINNLHKQHAYFIVPNRFLFDNNNNPITDKDINKQINLKLPSHLKKKLDKFFGDSIDDEYNYFTYLSSITGFKGITKTGKPRKSMDAVLIKYGI